MKPQQIYDLPLRTLGLRKKQPWASASKGAGPS